MSRLALCFATALLALNHHHPGPPSEKPVVLWPGLGIWRHSIATKNPEAQKFFDQGLTLLYSFNRYEALRSFRKANELDPSAAMTWWGIAMAQGPHVNMDLDGDVDMKNSCAGVAAASKTPGMPENESAWINAVAKRCPEYLPDDYKVAMRELAVRYPDDADVLTFYAESLMLPVRWRWYDVNGRPTEGVPEAETVLETILRRHPGHPGANHLYIHAVESSSTPERAIPSAQRLMGIVPSAGHLVHMPGHIWFRLGDYEQCATVNERAVQLDRKYMNDSNVTGSAYFGYYVHNLHFIAISRSMQGRMRDAIDAAEQMATAVKPFLRSMPEMADAFTAIASLVRVRFQRWDDVLAAPLPPPALAVSTGIAHYSRAIALEAKGLHSEALTAQAQFEKSKVAPSTLWSNNKAEDIFAVAAEVLTARLSRSAAASIPHWKRAVALQDALIYDEPPGWYYPVRESLGAALLRAGMPADAENVFREGLRREPRDGRMLFGLLQSLKAQHNTQASEWVAREFETAWRHAEVILRIEEM